LALDVLYEPVSNEVSYTLAWPISFPGRLVTAVVFGCVVLVLWSLKLTVYVLPIPMVGDP